jgi:hypothetical protein
MVNYKIVNEPMVMADTPVGYVEIGGDIVETKTNQIIKCGLGMKEAKELVRHLNFGGGFDGETPTFFLVNTAKILTSSY